VLVAAGDGERFVTGGDDGRVAVTGADGSTRTLAEAKGAWIDTLALHAGGAYAFGAGRRVVARDDKGRERTLEVPSAARGLAFAPKGYRLAVSHYNGVSLWFPNLDAAPEALDWKGSHLDVTWSPDGRFVVTSMQENALHGWRLQPDKGHMRMSGYPSKTRCLAWSRDGKWLGTSGAEAAILWPFDSKEGPTGKAPRECGVRAAKVTQTAFHPASPVLAAAYEDGCILLIRLSDASELLARRAVPGSGVTALAWDKTGRRLAFGCADGQAGVLNLPLA
jgi:WD40 repeat protein